MTKRCTLCGEIKPIEQFYFHRKATGKRHSRCKSCAVRLSRAWNVTHPDRIRESYLRNRERYRSRRRELNRKGKQFIRDYLADHPCVDCGEKDPEVLQFDHVSGDKGDYRVVSVGLFSIGRIRREIAKCEVRCANCHVRRHRREQAQKMIEVLQ